jgi:hypothetical protein
VGYKKVYVQRSVCAEAFVIIASLRYYTPQVALWGVERHGKAGEPAHGVVQIPLRLTVEFDVL